MMELTQHASVLSTHLAQLGPDRAPLPMNTNLLDPFTPSSPHKSVISQDRVHAALVYLSIVLSGQQPGNTKVRNNVHQAIEPPRRQISPALILAVVWPPCAVGCVGELAQELFYHENGGCIAITRHVRHRTQST